MASSRSSTSTSQVARVEALLDARAVDVGARQTPSFMVAASGCAPPMPPSPPVTTSRPASVPPKWRTAAAKVS
jgi:hypothetical protein